jgi:hypothetical protein
MRSQLLNNLWDFSIFYIYLIFGFSYEKTIAINDDIDCDSNDLVQPFGGHSHNSLSYC